MSCDRFGVGPDVAVSVRDVSKKFRLFSSPQERLAEALHPFRKQYHKAFWALDGISFDILRGQTVGVLGRNGSGKSTLLQIISGVMKATRGEVRVAGRVAALLELGAGFNPEFTGRANAMLNGVIAGIARADMATRMPEIEAFADIGQFFDQPVKTYSSGMYARLAFACAVHVEPEILVVDEALSVGDAKFQNKCYMQFKRFQASGKTIIFVSHSTEAILRNCNHAILIEAGRLTEQGDPQTVVDRYYDLLFPSRPVPAVQPSEHRAADLHAADPFAKPVVPAATPTAIDDQGRCEQRNTYNREEFRFGDREVEVEDYILTAGGVLYPTQVASGAPVSLFVRLKVNDFTGLLSAGFALKTVDGVKLHGTNTIAAGLRLPAVRAGERFWIRFDLLMNVGPGDIFIDLGCGDWSAPPSRPLDRRHSVIHLIVEGNGQFDGLSNCFSKAAVAEFASANLTDMRAESADAQAR